MDANFAARDFPETEALVTGGHAPALGGHAVPTTARITGVMHPFPLLVAGGSLVAMVAIFAVGIWGPGDFWIAMMINAVSLTGFLAIPALFARMSGMLKRRSWPNFSQFVGGYFDTFTGPMPGWSAFVLVVTIPVCLLAASVALVMIYRVLQ